MYEIHPHLARGDWGVEEGDCSEMKHLYPQRPSLWKLILIAIGLGIAPFVVGGIIMYIGIWVNL